MWRLSCVTARDDVRDRSAGLDAGAKEIRLQFPLVERLFHGEEVKDLRVLERLPCKVGLRGR